MWLKFEINLCQFSANVVAANLWEHEKTQSKIKEYFADYETNKNKRPDSLEWFDITKEVLDRVSLLSVPEELLTLLRHLIKPFGEKIFYWNTYVFRKLCMISKHAYKPYWTSFGTIDESKIFEKYWVPAIYDALNKVPPDCDGKETFDFSLILLACLFIQKKFLRENICQMIVETKLYLAPVKIIGNNCSVHAVIVIWICIYSAGGNKKRALELYETVKKAGTKNEILFMLSVKHGLLEATKYFWNRLSQEEISNVILPGADTCLVELNEVDYYQEKLVEILVFIINNLIYNVKKASMLMSRNGMHIFQSLMKTFPFQMMVKPIIDEFVHGLASDQVRLILYLVTASIVDDNVNFFSKNVCHQIIPKIYKTATKDVKIVTLCRFNNFFLLKPLINCFDASYLSLVLNDPDLSYFKEQLLEMVNEKSKDLIKSRNFGLLNKFLKNVFHSETERKKFKLKIKVLPDLIRERNYKLADEVLNWLAISNEEIILIKKQIDPIKICSEFKNFKCEQIDELLLWLFDAEEEKRNAKEAMKEKEFIKEKIIQIWNGNGREGENECSKFLKWLLGSEAEVKDLKKNLLIDEKFVKQFSNALPSPESFSTIDDLFQFLLLEPKKYLEIKEKIIKNIDTWIRNYIVTDRNFKMADAFVSWIFVNESPKKKAMINYVNSSDGIRLLLKTLLNCDIHEDSEPLLLLINTWVNEYGIEHRIKEKLNSIELEGYHEVIALERLVSILKWK